MSIGESAVRPQESGVIPAGALARVRTAYGSLHDSARAVADFIVASPEAMIRLSVRELATRIGVSEATVTRCCQTLGYSGLRELKLALAAEQATPLHGVHDLLTAEDSAMTIVQKVLRSDMQAIADTLALLNSDSLDRAVQALRNAPRVEFYGAGSSIPVVLDAYHRFLRIGVATAAVTDPYFQLVAASQLPPGAVAFGISHSGRSIETLNALRAARAVGATTILLSSHANSPLAEHADITLITADHETAYHQETAARRIVHLSIIDALCAATALGQPQRAQEARHRVRKALAERTSL